VPALCTGTAAASLAGAGAAVRLTELARSPGCKERGRPKTGAYLELVPG